MARGRPTAAEVKAPKTTAQRLDGVVKSARKIMRKDKGLNGDLDRLPMLTWIMFLKFLDDMEWIEEDEAAMEGLAFHPAIASPYRWRDWAAAADGITGPDLLNFITAEEAARPDGTRGPGLFTYLRGLQGRSGRRDRRDVIATVFRGLQNRMGSGYLLREVVILVGDIHFDASDEIHTLSRLYEGLIREMRDAAGDSGEFYTPRPVVRLMVELVDPRLGEVVLDPACGTGGFLAEAFDHLTAQADTVEKRERVQRGSLLGGEAKGLPYLLAQMNLLLHGLESPDIDPGNGLRFRLAEIGEGDRVDVILTNPPFAGEEEAGILTNFPDDRRTAETALLFLQVIMRRLKRGGRGRAAVVVPTGLLFGDGIGARIKGDLLSNFNLHTVVRLPDGVFAPYTNIQTNLLFFDSSGPTDTIWYWEQPTPEGRRKYSKLAPLQWEEFAALRSWWANREEGRNAWRVPVAEILRRDETGRVIAANLDQRNPHALGATHRLPKVIVDSAVHKQQEILAILEELRAQMAEDGDLASAFRRITAGAARARMGDIAPLVRREVVIDPDAFYPELGIRSHGKGTFHKAALPGIGVGSKRLFRVEQGDLVLNIVFAWEGAVAVASIADHGRFGSHRFLTCVADSKRATASFLRHALLTPEGLQRLGTASPGGAGRNRTLGLQALAQIEIPVPSLDAQCWFNKVGERVTAARARMRAAEADLASLLPSLLQGAFGSKAEPAPAIRLIAAAAE